MESCHSGLFSTRRILISASPPNYIWPALELHRALLSRQHAAPPTVYRSASLLTLPSCCPRKSSRSDSRREKTAAFVPEKESSFIGSPILYLPSRQPSAWPALTAVSKCSVAPRHTTTPAAIALLQ